MSRPSISVQSVESVESIAAFQPSRDASVGLTFDEVYRAHLPKVLQWARAFGCRPADLEDVAHDVFLVVRRRLPDYDGANTSGWLYRITQRMARDQRWRAWFRRVILGEAEVHQPGTATDEALAATVTVQRVLDRMHPQRRAAFVLFEVDGYSGEEIAELEGVPVGTVWRRLHQARREFVELANKDAEGAR